VAGVTVVEDADFSHRDEKLPQKIALSKTTATKTAVRIWKPSVADVSSSPGGVVLLNHRGTLELET
jgi:hypothetical protein